jgi:DNA polymerase-3 subunit epsilon
VPIWPDRRRRRLAAPALDVPWREAEYCVLDFETTGLDLKHDDIVSFGLVPVLHGRIRVSGARYGLVQARRTSSVPAFVVHGLSEQDLAAAMPIEQCAAILAEQLSGRVLVAHAAWIERPLIDRALAAAGLRFHGRTVDTAALARRAGIARSDTGAEPDLEWLSARLQLPPHTPHHALGDAMTTAQVLIALCSTLDAAGLAGTAADLVRLSASTP